jgi:hypothetical protein
MSSRPGTAMLPSLLAILVDLPLPVGPYSFERSIVITSLSPSTRVSIFVAKLSSLWLELASRSR